MAVSSQGRSTSALMIACAAGFMVWAVLSLAAGHMDHGRFVVREAWDTAPYFPLGLPVLLVAAGLAGFLAPVRVWRWALIVVAGHAVAMVLIHPPGTGLGLLPLTIVFIGLPMTVILTVAAVIGAIVARRGWSRSILA